MGKCSLFSFPVYIKLRNKHFTFTQKLYFAPSNVTWLEILPITFFKYSYRARRRRRKTFLAFITKPKDTFSFNHEDGAASQQSFVFRHKKAQYLGRMTLWKNGAILKTCPERRARAAISLHSQPRSNSPCPYQGAGHFGPNKYNHYLMSRTPDPIETAAIYQRSNLTTSSVYLAEMGFTENGPTAYLARARLSYAWHRPIDIYPEVSYYGWKILNCRQGTRGNRLLFIHWLTAEWEDTGHSAQRGHFGLMKVVKAPDHTLSSQSISSHQISFRSKYDLSANINLSKKILVPRG